MKQIKSCHIFANTLYGSHLLAFDGSKEMAVSKYATLIDNPGVESIQKHSFIR